MEPDGGPVMVAVGGGLLLVNVQVTVSPAPSATVASGGEDTLNVDAPLPEGVIAHVRPDRFQPPGTVSVTDLGPGTMLVNDVEPVPLAVVILKLDDTPVPVPLNENVLLPPTVFFTTTRFPRLVSVKVQVIVAPTAGAMLAGCAVVGP